MMVLLGAGKSGLVGGGEWRATAALVTCSSSMLRVGLLLLENGASVGPFREVRWPPRKGAWRGLAYNCFSSLQARSIVNHCMR